GSPCTGNNHVFQSLGKSLDMRGARRGNGTAAQRRRRPMSLDLNSDWWLEFGVATEDIQGFVRQIADFYLLFFNSTIASA
ncbi:hypothetical protein H4S02_013340, partial [Coemansia sp. RSA 2611]